MNLSSAEKESVYRILKSESSCSFFKISFTSSSVKILLFLMLMFFTGHQAAAMDFIKASNVTVTSYISEGYIELKIPIYETSGSDEGILPGSYFEVNDEVCLWFRSMDKDDSWQSDDGVFWVDARRSTGAVKVFCVGEYYDSDIEVGTSYAAYNFAENGDIDATYATFRIYLKEGFLGKSLTFKVHINPDQNGDGDGSGENSFDVTGSISEVSYSSPNPDYTLSSSAGKYDVSFSLPTAKSGSKYKWDIDSRSTATVANSATTQFSISDNVQSHTLYFYHKVSDYQYYKVTGNVTLPAYQQPYSFTAGNLSNGDTRISWRIAGQRNPQQTGDQFEVERSLTADFKSVVPVGKIDYTPTTTYYSIGDETSKENINGTVYYRIRRTKTAANWQWAVRKETSIYKSMKHRYIANAHAAFKEEGNIVRITWNYDDGNVWTDNSEIILIRTNITTAQVQEFSVPVDSIANRSYSEELYQMCNEYEYKIYVKPGISAYSTQGEMKVDIDPANRIIPIDMGALLSINASKGYFSTHTELTWETDGKAMDLFAINRRLYNSGEDFKQIELVEASAAATDYQFNDETGNPGQIYEYKIVGLVNCADGARETEPLYTYGFRTPTGDLYGRVTFENGQAVENVEIIMESSDGIIGKSMVMTSGEAATINNNAFLESNTDSLTVQAWISPDNTAGTQKIFTKPGMYDLRIKDDHLEFEVAGDILSSSLSLSSYTAGADFIHVTAVNGKDSLFLFVNGSKTDALLKQSVANPNSNMVTLGIGYAGAIDEVRVWNRILPENEIRQDYKRYITGGEKGLIAYWSFNYATADAFYDLSHKGSRYNENHGQFNGATLDEARIPTNEQLGFKGVTSVDGSYSVRAIPYIGNGTAYTIIPRMGIHTFESQKEVRFIGEGSQSHTVNFIDKSSFEVSGTVTYKGGTMPVPGVSFYIDGVVAMQNNGTIILTDNKGEFTIRVPVGIHEVKAVKPNHQFENEGKLTDSYGQDLNYQDVASGFKISDITTVKYIGRVAGGAVQDQFPAGHSLSKNNLADGIEVVLTSSNPVYDISSDPVIKEVDHFIPSAYRNGQWSKSNLVRFNKQTITIYPNAETGEFVAHIIPERFRVDVIVPGHPDIPGSGQEIDFSQKLVPEKSVHDYEISKEVDGDSITTEYSDTVYYNALGKFIKRYPPTVRITETDKSRKVLPCFGDTLFISRTLDGSETKIPLFENGSYLLGKPVYEQNSHRYMKVEVFESYAYCDNSGNLKGTPADEVPTRDASVQFSNNMAKVTEKTVAADSTGLAWYEFSVTEPELTSAQRAISAKVYYGDKGTSINWENAFDAIILGSIQTGNDFVTGGPDRVLMVLRDPPGSNSYSYLEKGVTVSESSTYTGSGTNTGSETWTQNLGYELITFTGVGAGVINKVEVSNGYSIGFLHEETVGGTNSTEKVTTTTTRFQTSDDPSYVGADADVFVGYSTNITYGATECVNIIPRARYDSAPPTKYQVYTNITPPDSPWLLVKQTGLGISESFATLFAYPQSHIENRLLPEMYELRNSLLMQPGEADPGVLQSLADANDTVFYISNLPVDDPNFGRSNNDGVFTLADDPAPYDATIGPSYRIIYPNKDDFTRNDTILYLNQSIQNWKDRLIENEKAKLEAELMQNYSFHGGAPVEYAESFSSTSASSVNFSIMIGLNFSKDIGAKVTGKGFDFHFEEALTTQHGGEWTDATEHSNTKGFVLSENGDDYLSVDVFRENEDDKISSDSTKEFYSNFIFRTKAGATSCPYEDAYLTKYYEPGKHTIDEATMQIEVPEIAVENDFIENVPSGGVANFTLYLRNNSEVKQDNWFTLNIIDEANPYGARMSIDGAPIGNGRDFLVPAGETLIKTLEVGKGSVMNYDDLKLVLKSQCQDDIADSVSFTVHYTPSCSDINIKKPAERWTYNTNLPVVEEDGMEEHFMEILLDGFDVNYDSFHRIQLQYKESSKSDDEWTTLMNYYSDSLYYLDALDDGINAEFIDPSDAGVIRYLLKMDDLPDQRYDLRALTVCLINNEEIENYSAIHSGIKDMYNPRLFGNPQPANGILTIEDDIRLNFNEPIADGYLTKNNFRVKGIRNGAKTDHSVSVSLDGADDHLYTEFVKNFADKDITVEMWINRQGSRSAAFFSHGNINEMMELSITADNHLQVNISGKTITSNDAVPAEEGSWAHVAIVYDKDGFVSAYYNFEEYISRARVDEYEGSGNILIGKSISGDAANLQGMVHNIRLWDRAISSGSLQVNSLAQLSGNEIGLLAYYPMTEAKGNVTEDKARGANLIMEGCTWTVPEGRSVSFNGSDSYLKINTGSSAVIDETMDYTLEFWFKGAPGQTNSTLLSNGRGDGMDLGGSASLIWIGFDSNGELSFINNEFVTGIPGDFLDNDWHHFALSINRTTGRSQICVDGLLKGYFDTGELGGMSAAYLYLGARAWYAEGDASSLHVDQYFEGYMDELRIWDLYKNESLVRNQYNVKLDGSEMGLLAYYPFEYYKEFMGRMELDFTLADQKIQKLPENVVPNAISHKSFQSADIGPVKDRGPVADLDFDFVVNEDALIINLQESWEKVEKTIVTFTVTGVRDMNGNLNISPITWSAYIDRNQLKWSENSLSLSKSVYQPLDLTLQVVNKGGAIRNFSISNMPSWMDVTPVKGSVDPDASLDIHFSIDPELNVGRYNEVIYLTNDNNVSEALEVNISVKGQKPEWKVDPEDYAYNMSLYGKMRFNNIFSADEEDLLAAFRDGECIGVTTSTYDKDLDMWYALLTIYGNDKDSGEIEFRMWDSGTGIMYDALPDRRINFVNDAIIGNPGSPVIFDGIRLMFREINLEEGWNWVSFNLYNESLSDINATLEDSYWTSGDVIKSKDYFDSYSVLEKRWKGDLSLNNGLDNTSMFMIHSSRNQQLGVSGTSVDAAASPVSIKANQWNFVGYLPHINLRLKEALAGYDAEEGDVIKSQTGFAMYYGHNWVGNLDYMVPGKGYMLLSKSAEDKELYYPSVSADNKKASNPAGAERAEIPVCFKYSGSLNIIATAEDLGSGDRIFAFVDGELRGIGEADEQQDSLQFINVSGDQAGMITFRLQKADGTILKSGTEIPFTKNSVYGSINNPLLLDFEAVEDDVRVYPTPFNRELNVTFMPEGNSNVIIKIYDISGKLVYTDSSKSTENMMFEKKIKTEGFRSGMYFVHVMEDGKVSVKKVVK